MFLALLRLHWEDAHPVSIPCVPKVISVSLQDDVKECIGQTEAEMSPDPRGWGAMRTTTSPQYHSDIPCGAIFTTVVMKLVCVCGGGLGQFLKLKIGVLSREMGLGA